MYNYNLFKLFPELPEPLSKEEFIKYYKLMKCGDSSAREKLIIHNIRLVIREVSTKFFNTAYEEDELVAVGLIGLINSVDKFDLSRNIEFSTFATKVIDNEILVFMRRNKKNIGIQSIYNSINTDKNGNNILIEETLVDPKNNLILDYEYKETLSQIMSLIDTLPERNRKILMLYFGFYNNKKYSQVEISKIIGISQPLVSRLIQRDLQKLQNIYHDITVPLFKDKNNDEHRKTKK